MAVYEDRQSAVTISAAWNGTLPQPAGTAVFVHHPSMGTGTVQIVGTMTATITFEVSTDELTFVAIGATNVATGAKATTATAAGLYVVNLAAYKVFRARCSAYTSGSPVVTMNVSRGTSDLNALSTGAAGAVTVADGANTVEGSTTDAAVSGDNSGTMNAHLRGVTKALAGTLTVGGQAAVGAAASGNPLQTGAVDSNTGFMYAVVGESFTTDGLNRRGLTVNAQLFALGGTTADRLRAANTAANTTGTGLLGVGPLAWDGTNWQKVSQPSLVAGTTGTGLLGAGGMIFDGTNWQNVKQASAGSTAQGQVGFPGAAMMIFGSGSNFYSACSLNSVGDATGQANILAAGLVCHNGASQDRIRNNTDVIIQAPTATVVSTINTDITTYNAGKLLVHINVSLFNAGNLTVKLQWKDANGLFMDIPGATTGALSAGGPDFLLALGANTWPANTATAFYANLAVPRQVRIVQTIAAATVTYSAAYSTNCN